MTTSGWKEAVWLFRCPLWRKASLQPGAGHLKFKSKKYMSLWSKQSSRIIPIRSVLQMDPSVLFQASSVYEALTTLGTWMRLDAKVRLQVPEPKILLPSQTSGFVNYLARSYCFLKVLSQCTQGRERWRFNELPCKVVLFLESLVTVYAGEGTMKV